MPRKKFCEYGPVFYKISLSKEIIRRYISDFLSNNKLAETKSDDELPNLVKDHTSLLLRKLDGVDMSLQINKQKNIELACKKINKILIKPGETFSFWHTVKKPTKRKGYTNGLVIRKNGLSTGIGGGLCQMANMIHWLVLHSPLEVTELHHHSDALFPDSERRVPFGTGTSITFNNVDYRFKNNTNQNVQILVWCENGYLCGELRSEKPFEYRYRIVEEDSHYHNEDEIFYRISKIYKLTINKETKEIISKDIILHNHSKVLYDYSKIPTNEIRNY